MIFTKNLKRITRVTTILLAFFLLFNEAGAVGVEVGSNTLTLGSGENLYYGVTASGNTNGNFLLYEKGPGNIIFRIDYAGNITTSGNLIGANNYWNLSSNNLTASNTAWNLGIGTNNPGAYKLNVGGDTYLSGYLSSPNIESGYVFAEKVSVARAANDPEGWVKIWDSAGGGVYTAQFRVSGGYNNRMDNLEFRVTTSGYGQPHSIIMLPTTSYNSGNVMEIRTNDVSSTQLEVWLKLDSVNATQPGSITVYSSDKKIPDTLSVTTTQPTWGAKSVATYPRLDMSNLPMQLSSPIFTPKISALNANGLYLGDDANNGIFIKDGGSVGIGSTNPNAILDISSKLKFTSGGIIYNTDSSRYLDMTGLLTDSLKVSGDIYSTAGELKTDGAGLNYMLGSLGIGTATPATLLDVNGQSSFRRQLKFYNDATLAGGIGSSYWLTTPGGANDVSLTSAQHIYFAPGSTTTPSMVLTSAGRLGIGTTNPSDKLEVVSNASDGTGMVFRAPNDTNDPQFQFRRLSGDLFNFRIRGGAGSAWLAIWDQSNGTIDGGINIKGNSIGIGTATPDAKLNVNGTFHTTGQANSVVLDKLIGTGNRIVMTDASGSLYATSSSIASGLPSASTAGATLYSNGSAWVASTNLYNNGGNIGIGTTGPEVGLSVQAASNYGVLHLNSSAVNGESALSFKSSDDTNGSAGQWLFGKNIQLSSDQFSIWNQANRLFIDTAGNVGVNTSAPVNKFDVVGKASIGTFATPSTSYNEGLVIHNNSSENTSLMFWQNGVASAKIGFLSGETKLRIVNTLSDGSLSNAAALILDSSGRLGIGSTAPGYNLDVVGTGNFTQPVIVGTPSAASHAVTKNYLDSALALKLTAISNSSAVDVNNLGDGFLLYGGSTGAWLNRGPSGHNGGAILHITTHPGGYYSDLWFDTANNRLYTRSTNANATSTWDQVLTAGSVGGTPWIIGGNQDADIANNNNSSAYTAAAVELRELNHGGAQTGALSEAPRLSFHWGSRVASQLALATDGTIMVRDNPGTGYEKFATGNFAAYGTLKADNSKLVTDGSGNLTFESFYDLTNSLYKLDPSNTNESMKIAGTISSLGTATNNYFLGSVGLGTAVPSNKLHVYNAVDGAFAGLAIDNRKTYGAGTGTNETSKLILSLSENSVTDPNSRIFGYMEAGTDSEGSSADGWLAFGSRTSGTASEKMRITSAGNVGIGTTVPGAYKLNVEGNTKINNGALTIVGDLSVLGSNGVNNGKITVNKLNVGTIDPLYNIFGTNYSSFAPSVVGGVKEEVVGKINISKKITSKEYQAVIDFNTQPVGSDLWVWHNVIDFNKDNVEVTVTPYGGFAKVYYYISGDKLIFRSDSPAEISYRLLAKRFDWQEWPTKAIDQTEKASLIIKK